MIEKSYEARVVYRGLCRAVPEGDGVSRKVKTTLLLVDGTSSKPTACALEKGGLGHCGQDFTREHHPFLEFRTRDLQSPAEIDRGIRMERAGGGKGETLLLPIHQRDLVFDGPGQGMIVEDSYLNGVVQFNDLESGAGETPPSYLQASPVSRIENLPRQLPFVARSFHYDGSLEGDRPGNVNTTYHFLPASKPDADVQGHPQGGMRLDVVVKRRVPVDESLRISVRPFGDGDLATLELRPRRGEDLELWVHNRELLEILQDDHLAGQGSDCPNFSNLRVDWDFELHYQLSAHATLKRIPVVWPSGDNSKACGCGCGGGTGGSE